MIGTAIIAAVLWMSAISMIGMGLYSVGARNKLGGGIAILAGLGVGIFAFQLTNEVRDAERATFDLITETANQYSR